MADLTDAPLTVLDHIDNIVVPGDVFAEPVNEYWALVWLREGMEYLGATIGRERNDAANLVEISQKKVDRARPNRPARPRP